jgi:hypothetical protein
MRTVARQRPRVVPTPCGDPEGEGRVRIGPARRVIEVEPTEAPLPSVLPGAPDEPGAPLPIERPADPLPIEEPADPLPLEEPEPGTEPAAPERAPEEPVPAGTGIAG